MPCFSQIVGQRPAIEALRRSLSFDRVAHAYLFSGPEGVGKRSTALALASALGCQREPGLGCSDCPHCNKISAGIHPDIVTLQPEGTFIKVEQVRALEPLLAIAPNQAPYRVVLLDGADSLHPSAANALLKSVEEPRRDTVFVLIAAASHRVLPTLVSRCRRVRFAPLSLADVLSVCRSAEDGDTLDDEALRWAAKVSEGSPGKARRLVASEGLAASRTLADQLRRVAANSSALEVFEAAEGVRNMDRQLVMQAGELLQLRLRDDLLLSAGLGADRLLFAEGRSGTTTHRWRSVLRQIEAVQQAQQALQSNANAMLTIERLAFALQEEATG